MVITRLISSWENDETEDDKLKEEGTILKLAAHVLLANINHFIYNKKRIFS